MTLPLPTPKDLADTLEAATKDLAGRPNVQQAAKALPGLFAQAGQTTIQTLRSPTGPLPGTALTESPQRYSLRRQADAAAGRPSTAPYFDGWDKRRTVVVPGGAALVSTSSTDQTKPAGKTLTAPSVRIVDGSGAGIEGVPIVFTVVAGDSVLKGPVVFSNSSGVARATSWKLGTAGAHVVQATVDSLSVTFRATAT
jgi:hypothetical protein